MRCMSATCILVQSGRLAKAPRTRLFFGSDGPHNCHGVQLVAAKSPDLPDVFG